MVSTGHDAWSRFLKDFGEGSIAEEEERVDVGTIRHRGERDEEGAVLVEFALISPFLFVILFGILDFGWAFAQILDTRHGAREAARLAAVDFQPTSDEGQDQTDLIVAEICARLESPEVSRVNLALETSDTSGGALATVRVERDLEQLTGFFTFLDDLEPSSEVTFRLERNVSWVSTLGEQACP